SNGSPQAVLSTTSWRREAFSGAGSVTELCGASAIEPGSRPRSSPLKTRIVKKEFGAASKRRRWSCDLDLPPFNRLRSRSSDTLPFATIIFSRVPVWLLGPVCLTRSGDRSELLLTRKSESRPIRIVFDINLGSPKFFGQDYSRTRTVLKNEGKFRRGPQGRQTEITYVPGFSSGSVWIASQRLETKSELGAQRPAKDSMLIGFI